MHNNSDNKDFPAYYKRVGTDKIMQDLEETHQVRPELNDPGTRDPIVAMEALLQIKDGVFGDRSYRNVEESPLTLSTVEFAQQHLPLPSDIETKNASSALPLIRSGKPWQQRTFPYRPSSTVCQGLKISNYQSLPPTPNPLDNPVCNIEPVQVLQPIAPKRSEAQNITVRAEKVEAALRSKPQRGKKRDNLNGLERLELTRTRNREHAKNTRMRKKARYEELVQNETKYFELKAKQELNNNLIENVMKFIDVRTEYMNTNLGEQNSSIWHISSSDIQTDKNDTDCEDKPGARTLLYDKIVEDTSCFKFGVTPPCRKTTGNGLLDLQMHDADVVIQVKSKVRKKAALSFNLLVKKDAIAISDRNTTFAEFTLQLISRVSGEDCQVISLCSGIIQFQLAHLSHKIMSVKDIITHNCLSSLDTIFNRDDCLLGNRTTYPSVVSLDQPCNLQNNNS